MPHPTDSTAVKGRGATSSPVGRYESQQREAFDDGWDLAPDSDTSVTPKPKTVVTLQPAKTILRKNDSPDIPVAQSINPYTGCEHGCIYCFARPTYSYWNLSPGLDFETKLFAKPNTVELLREELAHPRYVCETISLGSNTDPYQPIERDHRLTRGILEVMLETRHPVAIVTKSANVLHDLDLLTELAKLNLVKVFLSVTTLDGELARKLEPRAAAPYRRLETLAALHAAGVPIGIMTAPIIPALTDHDLEAILEAGQSAGVKEAGYVFIRLPWEVKALFEDWLTEHFPERKAHVLSIIAQSREGKANDPRFGTRMTGEGIFAQLIAQRFKKACARLGLNERTHRLDRSQFRPPELASELKVEAKQGSLF